MVTVLPVASAGASDQPVPLTVIPPLYGTVVGVRVRWWPPTRERSSTTPSTARPIRSRTMTVPATRDRGRRRRGAGGEDSTTAVRIDPPPHGTGRVALFLTPNPRVLSHARRSLPRICVYR